MPWYHDHEATMSRACTYGQWVNTRPPKVSGSTRARNQHPQSAGQRAFRNQWISARSAMSKASYTTTPRNAKAMIPANIRG